MSKTCRVCLEEKTLDRFATYNNGYGVKTKSKCKDCRNLESIGGRKDSSRVYYEANTEKLRSKKIEYYGKNVKELQKYSRDYYGQNREIISLRLASRTYGIPIEEVTKLRKGQCAICGTKGKNYKKGLHIDHCHSSGNVRGVLCHACNVTLGLIKEDINTLNKMKEYILEHSN